ncbi:MAG: hypothetical protein Ta2E_01190 [Mycoplasmoidaceae bacterium]|nr:MAG: hypothetical protein Ta2E_01190 [Mycoplasmoidaceae bacterium]
MIDANTKSYGNMKESFDIIRSFLTGTYEYHGNFKNILKALHMVRYYFTRKVT